MERKEFIRKILVGGSILLTTPAILDSCTKTNMTLPPGVNGHVAELDLSSSKYKSLNAIGGYIYVQSLIVIHPSDTQYVALSSICTHQSCIVGYNSNYKRIVCPCHGSQYDLNGKVLVGPAPRSLKKYTVTLDGSTLVIA